MATYTSSSSTAPRPVLPPRETAGAAGGEPAPPLSAVAAATAAAVFGNQASDHLPQEFRCTPPGIPGGVAVLSWNIMARGLNRRRGGSGAASAAVDAPGLLGAAAEGKLETNNGLELDETLADYSQRLCSRVAPCLGSWLRGGAAGRRRAVCLQEAPAHPGLLSELLSAVAAQARLPRLRFAELRESAASSLVTAWNDADWELQMQAAHAGTTGHALCTELAVAGTTLRLLNCHLPARSENPAVALAWLDGAPCGRPTFVLGDLNADLRAGPLSDRLRGRQDISAACVPDSATYCGIRSTLDAALFGFGRGKQGSEGTEAFLPLSRGSRCVGEEAVEEERDWLGGLSRADFIGKNIHWNLQEKVRSLGAQLSDKDLGHLAAHHFGDHAEFLSSLLAKLEGCRAMGSSARRPLAVAAEPADAFDALGRDAFVRRHVHRKLHGKAAGCSDDELRRLGSLPFQEQPAAFAELSRSRCGTARGPALSVSGGRCARAPGDRGEKGGAAGVPETNEAAMLRLVGLQAPSSSADDGAAAAASSRPTRTITAAVSRQKNVVSDVFDKLGVSRDKFIKTHIHLRLQEEVKRMPDEQVFNLGQLHFSAQAEEVGRLSRGAGAGYAPARAGRGRGTAVVASGRGSRAQSATAGQCLRAEAAGDEVWSEAAPAADAEEDAAAWGEAPRAPNSESDWDAAPGAGAWDAAEATALAETCAFAAADASPPGTFGGGRGGRTRLAGDVIGLTEWLDELCLQEYLDAARHWCDAMGAASLEEVMENGEDFAESLGLRPLERKRLLRSCAAAS